MEPARPLLIALGALCALACGATTRPVGDPIDVLTGFVDENGGAMGRPVGVVMDKGGALLVADDVGNAIWRVSRPGSDSKTAPGR